MLASHKRCSLLSRNVIDEVEKGLQHSIPNQVPALSSNLLGDEPFHQHDILATCRFVNLSGV